MKNKNLWIVIGLLVLMVMFVGGKYNGLQSSKVMIDTQWSQVDNQLQRRFDLIPNLVETVKGYMTHESETFEKIAKLRTSWANTSSVGEKAKLDGELSSTLKTIMAVSENYPELKANTNFLDLQNQLKSIEDDIANARKYFNGVTRQYNTKIEVFPMNLLAGIFGFTKKPLFVVADEQQRQNVKVSF